MEKLFGGFNLEDCSRLPAFGWAGVARLYRTTDSTSLLLPAAVATQAYQG